MSLETVNAAMGKWHGILVSLGVDPKYLTGENMACPTGHGKDCFRFVKDDPNGKYFCSKCERIKGDGFDLLMAVNRWDFKKAASEVDRIVGNIPVATDRKPERSEDDKAKACRQLLEGAGRVVPGTPAHLYLLNRCGDPGAILGDLRAHPGIRHTTSGGIHPAMLAIMRYPDGGGASVHRTYLTADGQKALVDPVRKMMPGLSLAGSCVRLGPIAERLGIAEGIETAICAGKIFNLPVWAATCANQMKAWEPPQGVREVVIFGDNDASFTGQEAAYTLAKRLKAAGLGVEVQIPSVMGQDWADAYLTNPGCNVKLLQEASL